MVRLPTTRGIKESPEGREFIRRSAAAWGHAHLAAGGEPEQVAAITEFYAPSISSQADKECTP